MDILKQQIKDNKYDEAWSRLCCLADKSVDYTTLLSLCKCARRLEREVGLPSSTMPLKYALIGGATLDMLSEPMWLAMVARGLAPDMLIGRYGQFVQEMIDPNSAVSEFSPQIIVVVNTPFNITAWPSVHDGREGVAALVDQACDALLKPCQVVHDRIGCEIVLNNLHSLPTRPLGNFGAKHAGDGVGFIRRVNIALADRVPDYVHINDVAAMVERRGLDFWFDQRYWFLAKQPIAFSAVSEYVRNTAAIVGALKGKTRKCLVIDLDNTIWGGVVGDDGVTGIELGEGTADGEAFKAFQLYLKALKNRGVLLAVCSKNDERLAKEAFAKHPEMVLTLEDFVAFKANWLPKSDNLRAIAEELSLGLDSLVFVDDNPAERAQVHQALPQVAMAELTEDPSDYPAIIEAGRYFEIVSLTDEDRARTASYVSCQAANKAKSTATDLTSYLKSLKMKATIRSFDDVSMERITQLTNKTNQFNLTTRRVTLSQIQAVETDASCVTLSVRLRDCFGDHGLISVFSARVDEDVMTIDDWLMSCRVLNRGVEFALFNVILDNVSQRGVTKIVGVYKPTDRNKLVSDHYAKLGFQKESESPQQTTWTMQVSEAVPMKHFISLELNDGKDQPAS